MAEQDRARWDGDRIAEGVALLTEVLPRGDTGQYQLQAAIAAVHDEAPSAEETDWPQIEALYTVLLQIADNPVVRLNHAVAVAMVHGPRRGLALVGELARDPRLADDHRLHSVRAHLLEMSGDAAAARAGYLAAAARATSLPVQRHLHGRAARLAGEDLGDER
jgi:predicted RNA polymerase sigma factor